MSLFNLDRQNRRPATVKSVVAAAQLLNSVPTSPRPIGGEIIVNPHLALVSLTYCPRAWLLFDRLFLLHLLPPRVPFGKTSHGLWIASIALISAPGTLISRVPPPNHLF